MYTDDMDSNTRQNKWKCDGDGDGGRVVHSSKAPADLVGAAARKSWILKTKKVIKVTHLDVRSIVSRPEQ